MSRQVLENVVAGRRYCISVCFLDRVSPGCGPPVCTSTATAFNSGQQPPPTPPQFTA